MATGDRRDPYSAFRFLVEIDGIARAGFRECSGLESTSDPIEYREGSDQPTARKLPGLVKYSNITLKRGVSDDADLWEWRKKVIEGKIERKNGSIILLNDAGEEKVRWNFKDGWPTKWTGPTFNATGNETSIESMEVTHEEIKRV